MKVGLIKKLNYLLLFLLILISINLQALELNTEEEIWLEQQQTIRIAPDPNFPPIEWSDEEGNYRGISADYMELISQMLGIKFDVVKCKSWDDVLQKARNREVDMLPAAAQTPPREEYMDFSDPYLIFPGVIITRKDQPKYENPQDLFGKKVVIVSGYVWEEMFALHYPAIEIVTVPNLKEGLRRVSMKANDILIATLPIALYYIEQEGIHNLQVTGETGFYTKLSILTRNDWPLLGQIMNKSLKNIPTKTKDKINSEWIQIKDKSVLQHEEFWYYFLGILVISFIVIAFIYQWNRSLKRLVKKRTEELEKDVEIRRRTEAELEESEKRLQNAQEIAKIGNFEWNFQSKKTYWSSQLYKIHGRDPEKGVPSYKEYLQHVYPEDREKVKYDVRKAKETGEYLTEYRIKRFDNGEIRYVQTKGRVNYDENSKPLLLEATEQDITKRKKTEKKLAEYREHLEELVDKRTEKLKKAQKELINKERLAAMGELAGGIAHEIKNPLATIDSSAVNLQYQNYEDEKINKHLGKIRDAVKRCVEVIDSLRRLKSKEKPQLETTNLNNFLTNTLDQIKAPEHIKLITKISQKNIFIKSDKAQLRICLKNLVRNSIDAIENEGKINVKLDLANTSKCKITITDNGIGIDKNELDKIFEPLYTSKSTGIGFGLSLVKRTLEVHDGEIKVNSKPGKGTTFEIILPIMESYI